MPTDLPVLAGVVSGAKTKSIILSNINFFISYKDCRRHTDRGVGQGSRIGVWDRIAAQIR